VLFLFALLFFFFFCWVRAGRRRRLHLFFFFFNLAVIVRPGRKNVACITQCTVCPYYVRLGASSTLPQCGDADELGQQPTEAAVGLVGHRWDPPTEAVATRGSL